MHSFSASKSPFATSTGTTTSKGSQPGTKGGQRPQGAFVGLSTTIHTPESALIPANYHQQDDLGLLSETGTTQIGPFEVLATHQAATFDDRDQGQSASSLSHSSEPSRSQRSSQPVDNVAPIVREEPSPDPTDKWIMMSGDIQKPFKCGHKGCRKRYARKEDLQTHFVTHTGDSKLRCYHGKCAGKVIYPSIRMLTRHVHVHHTFERPFGCDNCDRRFRRVEHLKYHREHVHSLKAQKKAPKPQSVFKSSSATIITHTASTSTNTSRVSQPELAAGQRQQGSYVGISKTIATPESMQIAASYHQQDGLRLLAEVSTSQINPFVALATHQTVTFDNEAVTTGIAGVPNLPSDQYQAEQNPAPTDKWIIVDKSQGRPYQCGYPGCDKSYLKRSHLTAHFVKHTGTSKFKCPHAECVGNEYFGDSGMLKRHIASKHTLDKPFQCHKCKKQFMRIESLKYHKEHVVHVSENEKKSPERKKK